jgi:hypothetical protein
MSLAGGPLQTQVNSMFSDDVCDRIMYGNERGIGG